MPLPLAPVATFALRTVAVSLAAYAVVKAREGLARDQRVEDALDDLPEGAAYATTAEGARAAARWRRTFRVGTEGPGITIDIAALGRVRIRRAP